MFPGMSCSASCLFCFHVAQECNFLFVVFSCFQECHVLLLVVFSCCPGMSCSGSCLLHFHVSMNVMFWFLFDVFSCFQECGVLIHVCCVFMFPINVMFWFMLVVFSCFP